MSLTVSSRFESVKLLANYIHVDDQFLIDCIDGLNKIIRKIVKDSEIYRLVSELEQIFAIFREIRYLLGQTEKSGGEIKDEITLFLKSLKCDDSLVEVCEIVKKRFKMYENELYISYDNEFVPRTNNDLEDFNHCLKRSIRKGQGRKESWFYVEHQGESAAYYHNLLNAPHVVGGADISWSSEKTPLERIGVLETISVTNIMNLITRECFYKSLAKNDVLYTVHRWTRKIFKQGLERCLASLDSKWTSLMKNIIQKKKIIKGGGTSSS